MLTDMLIYHYFSHLLFYFLYLSPLVSKKINYLACLKGKPIQVWQCDNVKNILDPTRRGQQLMGIFSFQGHSDLFEIVDVILPFYLFLSSLFVELYIFFITKTHSLEEERDREVTLTSKNWSAILRTIVREAPAVAELRLGLCLFSLCDQFILRAVFVEDHWWKSFLASSFVQNLLWESLGCPPTDLSFRRTCTVQRTDRGRVNDRGGRSC